MFLMCWCCCCKNCSKTQNKIFFHEEERKTATEDEGELPLLQIISSHEREFKRRKRLLECLDEELETAQIQGVAHDVVTTSNGQKGHFSPDCSSVRSASANRTYTACKHCVKISSKPR